MNGYRGCFIVVCMLLAGNVAGEESYTIPVSTEKRSARDRQAFQEGVLRAVESYVNVLLDELQAFGRYIQDESFENRFEEMVGARIQALKKVYEFFQQGTALRDEDDKGTVECINLIPLPVSGRGEKNALIGIAITTYGMVQKELVRVVRGILEHDAGCFFVRIKNRTRMQQCTQTIESYIADSRTAAYRMNQCTIPEPQKFFIPEPPDF